MAAAGSSETSTGEPTVMDDISDYLPLQLIKSETIPPAPNISDPPGTTIDWLPDFAGYTWVAYGASSLLVISHFPSPLSLHETSIGPIFRQVLELPSPNSADVAAVSWSPSTASAGDLAAAVDNRIFLFSYDPVLGSFCWSQTAVLVQSTKAETIKWTGSGDGIVSGGIEVVLWKRNNRSWEIAWKFGMGHAQTLVSTAWSIDGPAASGVYPSKLDDNGTSWSSNSAAKSVRVYRSGRKSGYVVSELAHPQPVLAIQWRHSRRKHLNGNSGSAHRHMLLTCCVDGTVRLWSEIEDGRVRKSDKNVNEPKSTRRTFNVCAVIEINQMLNGVLGSNIHISWPLEVTGISSACHGVVKHFSALQYEDNKVGRCEWLIALGPGTLVTFWAVHCLDDSAPMRPPRVTLWKQRKLHGPAVASFCDAHQVSSADASNLIKAVISRDEFFGPPVLCSLVQLLPCSCIGWSLLYMRTSGMEGRSFLKSENLSYLSDDPRGILNVDGHTGKVLQVSVHPRMSEVTLAVSLDSNGLLLFWSFSASSNCISGLPTPNPSWKLLGKLALEDIPSLHVRLSWAPFWLDEVQILLVGHIKGIDCLIIRTSDSGDKKILCHKLCTIPFMSGGPMHAPDNLFSTPLNSTCKAASYFHRFMLIGVWRKGFHALSWEVTLRSSDLNEPCYDYDSDTKADGEYSPWTFVSEFDGRRYCMVIKPRSSCLPDSDSLNCITSTAVVNPTVLMPCLLQTGDQIDDSCPSCLPYHLVTGHSDGSVRLWRSILSNVPASDLPWELVGMFTAHVGPIAAISVADCGQKIATVCSDEHKNSGDIVCVWEPANLAGTGYFLLEDAIPLKEHVLRICWLTMGTGQLFLGVSLCNELHVYAQRRCNWQTWLNVGHPSEEPIWLCIAIAFTSPPILDFFWGPMMTLVVLHENCFSIFCQWSLHENKIQITDNHLGQDNSLRSKSAVNRATVSAVSGCGICISRNVSTAVGRRECKRCPTFAVDQDQVPSSIFLENTQPIDELCSKNGPLSILEVAGKLCGPLPLYHPVVLSQNVFTGNWKRAFMTLRHLVECLVSTSGFEESFLSAKSSHGITQIKLPNYFEGLVSTSGTNGAFHWSQNNNTMTFSATSGALAHFRDESAVGVLDNFVTSLENISVSSLYLEAFMKLHALSAITDSEKLQSFVITDFLNEISSSKTASTYDSLDEPGKRFWCSVRLQQLDFHRRYGRMPSTEELDVHSKLIAWAFHSDCQETLFNFFLSTETSWLEMRNIGVGFWYTNAAELRGKMEKLARSQYLKSKDPKDCALLYIALNRVQVLSGLFKISKNEKDKPLVAFLSRNFQEEKHKAAALKNAYVLMGRHQLELAIAFFLLGGDTMSAISVCAKNLGDEQLAFVICRLVEGKGGPLEQHLISKIIFPSAIEKGDYWLASILEWMSGNYIQSFQSMVGFHENSCPDGAVYPFKHAALGDPSIGQYCQTLAAKSSLRNAAGEQNSASLSRWAISMTAAALNKCGLPLEALECLSSSSSVAGNADQKVDAGSTNTICGMLSPSLADCSNWISTDVSFLLQNHAKSDLAMQHISKLLWEHPCWISSKPSNQANSYFQEDELSNYVALVEKFREKLNSTVTYVEQRFSLMPNLLLNKILVSLRNHGLLSLGYPIVHDFASHNHPPLMRQTSHFLVSSDIPKYIWDSAKDIVHLISRFVSTYSLITPRITPSSSVVQRCGWSYVLNFYLQGILLAVLRLKAAFLALCGYNAKGITALSFIILDLCTYCVYLISSERQRDLKALILMVQPLLTPSTDEHYCLMDSANLRDILTKAAELVGEKSLDNTLSSIETTHTVQSDDERWRIIEMSLWHHTSLFLTNQLDQLLDKQGNRHCSLSTSDEPSPMVPDFHEPVDKSSLENLYRVCGMLAKSIGKTVAHISSYHARQLAVFLWQKLEDGSPLPYLQWLEEFSQSQARGLHEHLHSSNDNSPLIDGETSLLYPELFNNLCSDPNVIKYGLAQVGFDLSELIHLKPPRGWPESCVDFIGEREKLETYYQDTATNRISSGSGSGFPTTPQLDDCLSPVDSQKREHSFWKRDITFQKPSEIYRRNGELFEALCINSIDQQQAALASNRKGIVFFNWNDGLPVRNQSGYMWSEADWPRNGWAGIEPMPVSTSVSPGIGIVDTNESRVGLAVATVGLGSVVRPGRDFTGGGAFGIPGYAGIGATGLGWQIQEDFDLVDRPATLETVSAKALATHPSRPLFLVGSSYTQNIYLWEFGEDKCAATYGVLPAAGVPPPYALASSTALNFDCCGHRFANATSDGTVCTWQLEVGGRSNVRPTESSPCFNGSASDVCYVSTSGSIIAVAGYSSTGVNVVIWDTLAPPATSQASVMCHEGGACSIAVLDKVVGSGSLSPLIVTGGKDGDLGLHDFRYIATGKTKRHRPLNVDERISPASAVDDRSGLAYNMGDQNRNGMLWYIPKAHSGTVTKISTIPNTSLFLTGSKDGDVKLWDARTANLVFHWPKMHEKHTFLRRSPQGFGGISRVAVTDIQVVSSGFLSCGGDGTVKLVLLQDL
ncbi:hypothetical protein Dimus_025386 [Dionaea muscipula]